MTRSAIFWLFQKGGATLTQNLKTETFSQVKSVKPAGTTESKAEKRPEHICLLPVCPILFSQETINSYKLVTRPARKKNQ